MISASSARIKPFHRIDFFVVQGDVLMDKRKVKFLAGSLIIVASIAWLGFSGFDESLAYYKTVDELKR